MNRVNGAPKRLFLYIHASMRDQLIIDGCMPDHAGVFLCSPASNQGCTNAYLYEYEVTRKGKTEKMTRWVSDVHSWRVLSDEGNNLPQSYKAIVTCIKGFKP